ncbi:hypothetical protein [Sphingorhabdus sp.]|uniref:hypothetical protein n=1 Tax=Sphingorhabdus sp. TaxID=1902408 RepID=UPI003D814347
MAAIITLDKSAQRKIGIDVFARRQFGIALQTILHGIECHETDNRLMLRRQHVNVPLGIVQIARVVNAFEQFELDL